MTEPSSPGSGVRWNLPCGIGLAAGPMAALALSGVSAVGMAAGLGFGLAALVVGALTARDRTLVAAPRPLGETV